MKNLDVNQVNKRREELNFPPISGNKYHEDAIYYQNQYTFMSSLQGRLVSLLLTVAKYSRKWARRILFNAKRPYFYE